MLLARVPADKPVWPEDSRPGVAAAKAAGLKCIAVTLEILTGLVSEGTVADPQNPTWRHDWTQR